MTPHDLLRALFLRLDQAACGGVLGWDEYWAVKKYLFGPGVTRKKL